MLQYDETMRSERQVGEIAGTCGVKKGEFEASENLRLRLQEAS